MFSVHLLHVLIPFIITSRMCEEDLQTVLMQYCAIEDTILSMLENLDVIEQYILPHDCDDDDEGEAVVLLAVED